MAHERKRRNLQTNSLIRKLCAVLAVATSFAFVVDSLHAAETWNRLASNKLASNKLASNELASDKLASNALSSTRLEANMATAELLATADGRDVYSYLIGCALPGGMSIQATVPGAPDTGPDANYTCTSEECVFTGSLGLAESWIDHRLTPDGQGWVSACIFARVNALDTSVAISLRGPNDNLTVSPDEAVLYSLQEGAFYGNLFTGDDPIDWNACRGADQAAGDVGGLADRECAEPDPLDPTHTKCGFNYAGDCDDFSPQFPTPYACKSFDAAQGTYDVCHAGPGNGKWPGLHAYREVITTYVAN